MPLAPKNLVRLTSLRAIAAFLVFVYHLEKSGMWAAEFTAVGYVGVAFFFVLSGFVLVWAAPVPDTASRFYRRRFARVYPAHAVVVVLIVTLPVLTMSKSVLSVASALTLTQAWAAPKWDAVYGVNGVSWTLSCEAAFYAVFPLALVKMKSLEARNRWALALVLFSGSAAVSALGAVSGYDGVVGVDPLIRFPEFLLGMTAALAIRDGWRPRWTLPQASVFAIGTLAVLTLFGVDYPIPNAVMTLPFVAVIASAAAADIERSGGMLTSRWAEHAGKMSFSFYLVHEVIIVNVVERLALRGVYGVVSVFVLSALAAALLHYGVEAPTARLLRGRRSGRPTDSEASDVTRASVG